VCVCVCVCVNANLPTSNEFRAYVYALALAARHAANELVAHEGVLALQQPKLPDNLYGQLRVCGAKKKVFSQTWSTRCIFVLAEMWLGRRSMAERAMVSRTVSSAKK
jgi:hypothetical protein